VEEFNSLTAAWVNVNAFEARCTGANLDAESKYRFTHAGSVIDTGLQPGYPADLTTKVDCYVMAAAQYLLYAGEAIHDECVRQRRSLRDAWKGFDDGNGPIVWKRWGERLVEIAAALVSGGELGFKLYEKNRATLTDMVIRARDKVVGLEPEMFVPQPVASATTADVQVAEAEAGTEAEGSGCGCRVETETVLLMRWFPFILRFLASKGRRDQDGRRR